jgi:hypothetical protein
MNTDRQKLAETVREALQLSLSLTGITVSGYSHEDYDRSMDALDVLAQPCQECVRLEAEVERWERQQIRPQEIIDRLLAAERQLEQTREALRDCRPVIQHGLFGGSPGDALRYVDRAIVRALAATEAPEQ